LLILSLFGLSKFDDVRKAADRADDLLQQAVTRLKESETKLTTAEKSAADLTERAKERAQDVDRELAALRDANAEAKKQIASLGQTVQRIETQLGGLSAQSETGNKPPGSVQGSPKDPAAFKGYGTWGILTGEAGRMVAANDFPWHDEFSHLQPGSAEFDQAWQALGAREADRFREQQRKFVQMNFFEPAVKRINDACGLDVKTRSRALQEVVFAMAVLEKARWALETCREMHDAGQLSSADAQLDERLIQGIYERAIASSRVSIPGLVTQLERDRRAALEQLATEQKH
jgi:hypothetical protein